ncbi:MAG: alcohol dehydrogenase catalytic domain-containing protein, partial [Hyphomicrobiaceae bacterium]|nr:alcohol dehydrogenase catalytic domain-containing protein [Hyphomicrobiaceae bacterium]
MSSLAVVMERPESLTLQRLQLTEPGDDDCIVDIQWSGISTGTERLLWTGRMPQFPGLGYPLVPGYESVGTVRYAGRTSGRRVGDRVFVPGASCYRDARGLFGGASARVVTAGTRLITTPTVRATTLEPDAGASAVLLALAATAYHVTSPPPSVVPTASRRATPELIVGHGVLGRLLAR